ncbi:MGMT family protein [Tumebacillus sp. ITR2]|uniref:MGMT family protein n=1 Tax=Tumebacillus amylolyticus TaxID=2801339 RepID=A0ABS1J982_9BACL|nr:MGMT family protein [Tumebacillus amylolyticus]MBL0386827.1 MGMT family protein [Tumebacillus amylolyticus]
MTPFTQRVVDILKSIPPGNVMTYGQVARLAGSPRAARQVVRVLHSMSRKYGLPWHRVINSKAKIGLDDGEEQRHLLELEGVEFSLGSVVDLDIYQFHPDIPPEQ